MNSHFLQVPLCDLTDYLVDGATML